jgi:uncharacterized protein
MRKQFMYFYFMKNEPDKIKSTVPSHIEYWEKCDLKGYQGGPFADRTGGLITFEAEDIEEAQSIASNDPFIVNDLIEEKWIKEWIVE